MKKLYLEKYQKIITPYLNNINCIISKMDNFDFEKEKNKLYDFGFSERFLAKKKEIIKNDRLRYFEKNRSNIVCNNIKTLFPKFAYNQKIKILDIGCGYGEYCAVLRGMGHEVLGINAPLYNDDFLYVNEILKIPNIVCDIRNGLPFSNKEFDMILCIGVLTLRGMHGKIEYIANEMKRICKNQISLKIHEKMNNYHKFEVNKIFNFGTVMGQKEDWIIFI